MAVTPISSCNRSTTLGDWPAAGVGDWGVLVGLEDLIELSFHEIFVAVVHLSGPHGAVKVSGKLGAFLVRHVVPRPIRVGVRDPVARKRAVLGEDIARSAHRPVTVCGVAAPGAVYMVVLMLVRRMMQPHRPHSPLGMHGVCRQPVRCILI